MQRPCGEKEPLSFKQLKKPMGLEATERWAGAVGLREELDKNAAERHKSLCAVGAG